MNLFYAPAAAARTRWAAETGAIAADGIGWSELRSSAVNRGHAGGARAQGGSVSRFEFLAPLRSRSRQLALLQVLPASCSQRPAGPTQDVG